jgi:diguanylate cyclase (GGDEF)-like protein
LRNISNRWKLAIDTWVTIAFITLILWHTGKIDSPLLSLYLFAIITAAITLVEGIALLEVGLISTICLFLSFTPPELAKLTLYKLSGPLILVFSFWLTAYVTIKLMKVTEDAKVQIERLAHADHLTGLYNLRIFLILMEQELVRSSRFKNNFSIMIIDADNFKTIKNDRGDAGGNKVIQQLADAIRSNLRSTDIIARYGGDKYVVLMPETGATNAMVAGERLRKIIEKTPFTVNEQTNQITASIGIAGYPDHGTAVNELLSSAENALLQSKGTGKNRISVLPDGLVTERLLYNVK